MTTAELLMDEIRTLSPSRLDRVLNFVHTLKREEASNADCTENHNGSWFESGGECPVCALHRDPVTGEPRYNAETVAAIEEGRAMLRGENPAKWYNSLDEMLVDLDADD